ncbi:MAG: hypothetical protein LJE85_12280 [Gammaproteobacteria bacterium]|nr:hypothetical protein [Gammaproteobacteria bacterium]
MSMALAATIFGILITVVVLFQLALAAGMPWGHLAMGGRYPGVFPPAMRIAALVQIGVLALLVLIVLTRAQMIFPAWYAVSEKAIWVVAAVSAISLVLNVMTPSKWERILWSPVALLMTVCSIVIALG